jgi:hypothetical protein
MAARLQHVTVELSEIDRDEVGLLARGSGSAVASAPARHLVPV